MTRPSVNYEKDWLDQLFLFSNLVWSGKGFRFGCDHYGVVNNHFPVYLAIFGMVTTDNRQPGDSSVSLPLTSEKAVFCKKWFLVYQNTAPFSTFRPLFVYHRRDITHFLY